MTQASDDIEKAAQEYEKATGYEVDRAWLDGVRYHYRALLTYLKEH